MTSDREPAVADVPEPAPRVLVVEDNTVLRDTMRRVLREDGFEADAAADGARGLRAALDRAYDLVVADVAMPVMDGLEMLKHLVAERPGQRALLVSGVLDRGCRPTALGLPPWVKVLHKPFVPGDLVGAARWALATDPPL